MANKFTRIQTTASRYQEAANALVPLTMISGQEALSLSLAAQALIGSNEELIYKYRDEFLHIQKAAENGLTNLRMKAENPEEFAIVARAWGFVCTVESLFETQVVYRKNLNRTSTVLELSNITVDWSAPTKPLIDIDYYRQSGNLVQLEDSTIVVPIISKIEAVKQQLGIVTTPGFNIQYSGLGSGAVIPVVMTTNGNYAGYFSPKNGGTGYRVGDVITISGFNLGGVTPANNAVITVRNTVNRGKGTGTITEYSITGTAGANAGEIDIELLGNGRALVVPNATAILNGFRVASDGSLIDPADSYPDQQTNFSWEGSYLQYSGLGTGAIFQIVASSINGSGLPYRFYLGPTRPQGSNGVSGTGYSVGDKFRISGTLFGGDSYSQKANDAMITVLRVNSTGGILSATISGTTANGFRANGAYYPPGVFIDNFNVTFLNGVPGTVRPILTEWAT